MGEPDDASLPDKLVAILEDGSGAEPLTRQQLRRRAIVEEKRETALNKMAANAEAKVLGSERAEQFARLRHMFFAFVRSQGRIRISKSDLLALEDDARLSTTVQENGDLMVSFERGKPAA